MTQKSLQGAIDQLAAVVRDVTDINFVPDDPSDSIPTFPAGLIFPESGDSQNKPQGVNLAQHNITIAVVTPILDRPHAYRIIVPILEPVQEAIHTAFANNKLPDIENLKAMSYVFQEVNWGGVDLFGFFLTIGPVKIQRNF